MNHAFDELRTAIREADAVAAVGARTQWEIGGPLPAGVVEVPAPSGIVAYDPAELTVTVGAGTSIAELSEVLAAAGQECVLDPRAPAATIGGVLAAGVSGHRRLRWGPLRDRLLEVRFVAADGRVVKAGGPTVKNVTGFDLPRLLVGSLGTIGLMAQVVLRCQPRPSVSEWRAVEGGREVLRGRGLRPSCMAWNGTSCFVLLEGSASDVAAQDRVLGAPRHVAGVDWPDGEHRGRISVRPGEIEALGPLLDVVGVSWLAEVGVGTVHVAASSEAGLAQARAAAVARGGWLLREAGAPNLAPFGVDAPNAALQARIRDAFDPSGKLNPGRWVWGDTPPLQEREGQGVSISS